MKTISFEELTGRSRDHLKNITGQFFLHKKCADSFLKLQEKSLESGFSLSLASAFRDFSRQEMIWNKKAQYLL